MDPRFQEFRFDFVLGGHAYKARINPNGTITMYRMSLDPDNAFYWEGPGYPKDDPRHEPWIMLPFDPFGGNYGPPPGPPGGGC